MSLKDNALAVLQRNHERNHERNKGITSDKKTMQLNTHLQANKVASNDLLTAVSDACEGLSITPQQFVNLLTEDDKEDILSGGTQSDCLRCYAESFNEGIKTGRIVFHPTTQLLIKHSVN
ncbi:MAG: hypothetical protein IIA06_08855 [Proteobacteria bacterium]|nr:hypothetical protein [Pseudomonadota bacterium]